MLLQIDDQIQLASDEWSFKLRRGKKRKGKTEWQTFAYYGTFEAAINGYANYRLRTCKAVTVTEALAEVKNLTTRLSTLLHPEFEVRRKPSLKVVR